MTLKYVSAASSTGRRKLGVNYIAAVNSSELKLTMLQRPFHGAPASACNPSVFINPGLSEAASGLATTLFVEPVSLKCQPTCEFLSYTISIYVLRRIDTYLIFIRYSLLKLNWIEFLEEKKCIHVKCCCPLLSDRNISNNFRYRGHVVKTRHWQKLHRPIHWSCYEPWNRASSTSCVCTYHHVRDIHTFLRTYTPRNFKHAAIPTYGQNGSRLEATRYCELPHSWNCTRPTK